MDIATRISGVGTYFPGRKITNEDAIGKLVNASRGYLEQEELKKLVSKASFMLKKAGANERFWCDEDEYCTDIGYKASRAALEDAGISSKELDLIIFTGMSKAFVEPATAHVLKDELDADNANVIDTQDACTSFMKSVQIADSLIKTGTYKTVLVVAGERTYDWADFCCKTVDELAWKFGSLTIGDGAGAIVLQATEDKQYLEDSKHMHFAYKLIKGTYPYCHIGLNHRIGTRYRLHSHSSRLVRTGLAACVDLVGDLLVQPAFKGTQYDNVFIHDIGRMIDEKLLPAYQNKDAGFPDNYRSYFPQYGNVGSISLPVCLSLAKQDGRLKRGNLALFVCPAAGVQAGLMTFMY